VAWKGPGRALNRAVARLRAHSRASAPPGLAGRARHGALPITSLAAACGARRHAALQPQAPRTICGFLPLCCAALHRRLRGLRMVRINLPKLWRGTPPAAMARETPVYRCGGGGGRGRQCVIVYSVSQARGRKQRVHGFKRISTLAMFVKRRHKHRGANI